MTTAPRASHAGKKNHPNPLPKELIGFESLPFDALQGWYPSNWNAGLFEESPSHQAVKAANRASANIISHSVGQVWAYIRQHKPR